jgi:hypothetical protein
MEILFLMIKSDSIIPQNAYRNYSRTPSKVEPRLKDFTGLRSNRIDRQHCLACPWKLYIGAACREQKIFIQVNMSSSWPHRDIVRLSNIAVL